MSLKRLAGACFVAISLFAGQSSVRADQAVIKIGVLTDLGGTYSDLGGPGSVFAVEQAVRDLGGEINGKKIQVFSADTQNKVDVAAAIARKWYNEGVDAIVDIQGSGLALAVVELAKQYNKAAFVTSSVTTQLSNENCSLNSIHYGFDTYALAKGTATATVAEGKKSWFLLAVDYNFGKSLAANTEAFVKQSGGDVKGIAWHPLDTTDFASYLLRAQESRADVVALANAGHDTTNAIKQAAEFGLTMGNQSLAGMAILIPNIHALGLQATQGMLLTEAFYWNLDDKTRAFSKAFWEKRKVPPTSYHAADYSVVQHFLKAVKSGIDQTDGKAVIKKMKEMKLDDFYARNATIRENGQLVHDLYLFRVKKPTESKAPWDYYDLLRTIPADSAFMPLSESKCHLVKEQ